MKIKIIEYDNQYHVTSTVNEHLAQGWELHGELQVTKAWFGSWYVQAVKKEG